MEWKDWIYQNGFAAAKLIEISMMRGEGRIALDKAVLLFIHSGVSNITNTMPSFSSLYRNFGRYKIRKMFQPNGKTIRRNLCVIMKRSMF